MSICLFVCCLLFCVARPEVGRTECVDALELLGGSLANDNDNYDIGLGRFYQSLTNDA